MVLTGVIALSGCSKDSFSDKPLKAGEISFESGILTKGGPVTGTQFASGAEVGVYTLENPGGTPTWTDATEGNANNLLMDNIACTANGSGGLTYGPAKLYKDGAKYSFFAYYPYTSTITAPSAGQSPKLACTFNTTPSEQVDYMYATPLENQTPTDNAKLLRFNHALTQITVKVVNGTEKAITLNSLKVKAPSGATLNISNGVWSSPGGEATYNLYGPATTQSIAVSSSFSIPQQLMLLPVDNGGAAYKFDMNVTVAGESSATDKTNQMLTLPSGGMQAGYSYEYTITYGSSSIQLSTSVVEWQHVSGPGITVK